MPTNKNNAGIVSINGNVKNGLIYYSAPSPTGGLPDRSVTRCGGRKKAKLGDWIDEATDWLKQRKNAIRNVYGRGRNALEDLSETLFNTDLTNDSPEVKRTNARLKNASRNLRRIGRNSIPGIVAEELIRRGYNEAQQMVNDGQGVYDSSADARDSQDNNPALGLYNLELPGVDTSNAGYNINLSTPRNLSQSNTVRNNVDGGNSYYATDSNKGYSQIIPAESNQRIASWMNFFNIFSNNSEKTSTPRTYFGPNAFADIPWFRPPKDYDTTETSTVTETHATPTPRRGGNSVAVPASSTSVRNDLPAVARPRTSLAVEANLDPGKIPASIAQAAHAQASDRQYGEYAGVTPRDWMSLAGNVAGSIGNWLATRNSPRITIAEPNRPFIEIPVRLKTNYNNRPQIANVEEQARRNYQNIRENTASSSAALARMQRVRNAATQNINELEAQRENIETQLTNTDRTNRQQVRARNARAMNQYYEDLASARTRQSIADAQRKSANQAALSNLFNNVNLSFQDFLGRMDRRESFNNTLAYLRAANPNYDDRMFKDNGANFINMYLQGLNKLVRK